MMKSQGGYPPLLVWLVWLLSGSSHASLQDSGSAMLEWINATSTTYMSKGFVHPAQEYREIADSDGMVTAGMFATAPIAMGETVAKIPWSHIYTGSANLAASRKTDPMDCEWISALARDIDQETRFGPLMNFLKNAMHQPPFNNLPSAWTEEGKTLMKRLVGYQNAKFTRIPPLEPTDWIDVDWLELCEGDPDDAMVSLLTVQVVDFRTLVPLLPLYNHRNGKWNNADVMTRKGRFVRIEATRDIQAGEQIYLSQNLCQECGGRASNYGTAELLRDYGFVEDYPQRWHFADGIEFEVDQRDDGRLTFQWTTEYGYKEDDEYWEDISYMKRELRRLWKLRNVDYRNGNPGMPELEWKTAWKFQQANIVALTMALDVYKESPLPFKTKSGKKLERAWDISEFALINQHYDPLEETIDDLNYRDETCNNSEAMNFLKHRDVAEIKTPYQEMKFYSDPFSGDMVLELDNVVQIASLYRPQYHEYVVHAAARFLDSVKRVIFVGGGDSMLLHEVLKYPELELVVGLELDQFVVRKSFINFQTQPHFDDPRVEWWFGDATKSLLLLPKDYWQSFDLVLVDLSETVMSLSVTGELDVFDALALLLKPQGIMVKNEQYMDKIAKIFDYSFQIVFECPIICDQVMTFGSNKADFLHAPLKDHGVPTLLYEPLVTEENRLDYMHDYQRNDARVQGKCNISAPTCATPAIEQSKSAGIMEIVDIEEIGIPLDYESLAKVLTDVVTEQGLEVLSTTPVKEGDTILLLVMKEGYIVARMWQSLKYCSMDINLWGRFDRLRALTSGITTALKSPLVSNFRVVVGGMFGSSTWGEDREAIGPNMVQARDCETKEFSDNKVPDDVNLPSTPELIVAALEASVEHLLPPENSKLVAVAICGPEGEICMAEDVLKNKSNKVGTVMRLSTCPELDSDDKMYECEITLKTQWEGLSQKTDLVVVDETAPLPMLQIVDSILRDIAFMESSIAMVNSFVGAWSKPEQEPWRRHFLEFYRRHYEDDPMHRGEIMIHSGSKTVEYGAVACGFNTTGHRLLNVEKILRERFPPQEGALDISLRTLIGGKYPWLEPWKPKEFLQSDYDNKPGLDQYYNQKPLAHHVVFQMEPKAGQNDFVFSVDSLKAILDKSLGRLSFECAHNSVYQGLGEGCVIACLNELKGSVLLTWDGRTHVDLSYYRFGTDAASGFDEFSKAFLMYSHGKLQITLQDQMARGTGRAINPASDLRTPEEVAKFIEHLKRMPGREPYVEMGDDDDEEEEDDEEAEE